MDLSENFWNTPLEDLKRGYVETQDEYHCLLCGAKFEKGLIYPEAGVLYEAFRYIRVHIETVHHSVFEHLIHFDKKMTGLTDHQTNLLLLFYQGKSDSEVQQELGIGSASTIRNHRFVLKEKERQAKVFLVLMELLKEKDHQTPYFPKIHTTATMVDERYHITLEESEKLIKKYFPHGPKGPLTTFAMKEKSKLVVLRVIAARFEADRIYEEKEVNEILKTAYEADYVTLRRYLIEYGFMDRKPDCSQYWLKKPEAGEKQGAPNKEAGSAPRMDRRAELKQLYKETKPEAGVYQIKNLKNGKIFIESTTNLKTINGRRLELQNGTHQNKLLEHDVKEFGPEAFAFEVLEVLEKQEDGSPDKTEALKKLKEKWLEKLKPFGDKGYHDKEASQ